MTLIGPTVLIVTAVGREVRRRVGPTAWAVLEELVARTESQFANGGAIGVRLDSLAEELGLSTPRVRAAVGRLAGLGIVEREQPRSPGTHRFASTRYRIVGTTGLVVAADAPTPDDGNPYAESPRAVRRDPDADGIDRGPSVMAPAGGTATRPRPRRAATRPTPATSVSTDGAAGSLSDRPAAPRPSSRPTAPSPQLSLLDPSTATRTTPAPTYGRADDESRPVPPRRHPGSSNRRRQLLRHRLSPSPAR